MDHIDSSSCDMTIGVRGVFVSVLILQVHGDGFIPGRSCGVRTPISYSELVPKNGEKSTCVFVKNDEAFQEYLRSQPTVVEGSWSSCSATCGGGVKTKARSCMKGETKVETSQCELTSETISLDCNAQQCLAWQPWSTWTGCPASCGAGANATQTRTRTCKDTKASVDVHVDLCKAMHGGTATESQSCICTEWQSWSAWAGCHTTCFGYVQVLHETRTRTCQDVTNNVITDVATCISMHGGVANETQACQPLSCTVTHSLSHVQGQSVTVDQSYNPSVSPSKTNLFPGIPGVVAGGGLVIYDNGVMIIAESSTSVVHYEFQTGLKRDLPNTNVVRKYFVVAPKGDQSFWIVGGIDGSNRGITSTEIFDPLTQTWNLSVNLPEGRQYPTILSLNLENSKHFIIGGGYEHSTLDMTTTWIYDWNDPGSGFQTKASLNYPRGEASAALLTKGNGDQVVLVAGGSNWTADALESVEKYELTAGPDQWILVTPLPKRIFPGPTQPIVYKDKAFMMSQANDVAELDAQGFVQIRADLTHSETSILDETVSYQSCGSGKCDQLHCAQADTDYDPGIHLLSLANIFSPRECQEACQHNPNCKYYTYVHVDKECFLKSNNKSEVYAGTTSGPRFCGSNCFEVGKSFDTADPVKVLVNVKRAEVCQWYCIQDTRCWFFVYHLKDAGAALEYKCILLGWKTPVNGPEAAHLVRGPKLCP